MKSRGRRGYGPGVARIDRLVALAVEGSIRTVGADIRRQRRLARPLDPVGEAAGAVKLDAVAAVPHVADDLGVAAGGEFNASPPLRLLCRFDQRDPEIRPMRGRLRRPGVPPPAPVR